MATEESARRLTTKMAQLKIKINRQFNYNVCTLLFCLRALLFIRTCHVAQNFLLKNHAWVPNAYNSLSLWLSLAMNNATDDSGCLWWNFWNGRLPMFANRRITGRMYARVFTALLFRVESLHSRYVRISANPITKRIRNIKQKQIDL